MLSEEYHTVMSSLCRACEEKKSKKALCPKIFVFVKGIRKVLCQKWSEVFRKTEWVSFSERIVAQSCYLILDSWDYWQPVKLLKESLMCS